MSSWRYYKLPLMAIVLYLGIAVVVYVQGNHGTLVVAGKTAQAIITLDGEPLSFPDRTAEFTVRSGEHRLHVTRGEFDFETEPFHVRRGQTLKIFIDYIDQQMRARIGRVVIGMDPQPEPTGPVAIQTSKGTYLRAGGENNPVTTDARAIGSEESFTLEWQKADHTEVFIRGHQNLYLRGIEMVDDEFVMVDRRGETELFTVLWIDRQEQTFFLMTPVNQIYVGAESENSHLGTTGRPDPPAIFRLVTPATSADSPIAADESTEPPGDKLIDIRQFTGHSGTISDLAVSPDGRMLASASGWPKGDRTAKVWDLATGQLIQNFPHLKPVESVAISPDGMSVLTGREEVAARIYGIETGQEIARFKGKANSDVTQVAFFPDGRRIVILCETADRGEIRVWDLQTEELVRRLDVGSPFKSRPQRRLRSRCMALTADGARLVASVGRVLKVWDTNNWNLIASVPHPWVIQSLAVSPDGLHVLTAMYRPDAQVRLLRLEDGSEVRRFDHIAPLSCVEFLPTGRHFVSCSSGQSPQLCVWDITSGEQVACAKLEDEYLCLAVTPDGRHVIGAGGMAWLHQAGTDFDLHLWQLPDRVQP